MSDMSTRSSKPILIAVTALGIAWRVIVVVALPSHALLPDEQQYWDMACGLQAGHGLQDELGFHAGRMPLYPAFLSIFAPNSRTVALIVQAIIGGLACGLTAWLAGQITVHDRRRAWIMAISGALVACDPYLVFFTRFMLTETIISTCLIGVVAAFWSIATGRPSLRRWTPLFVLLPICIYVRPSSPAVLAALGLWLIAQRRDRTTLAGVVLAIGVTLMALLPWAARNHSATGRWTLLTHRIGISLYDGLGPQATGASDLGDIKQAPEVRHLDEVERNAYFRDAALRSALDDPWRALRLGLIKMGRTWRPWPAAPGYDRIGIKIVGGTWSAILAVGVLAGWWHLRHRAATWILLVLPAATLTLMHAIFVGSLRYRLPAIPALAILAAVGLISLMPSNRPGAEPPESASRDSGGSDPKKCHKDGAG
jgi:hypothetical protein